MKLRMQHIYFSSPSALQTLSLAFVGEGLQLCSSIAHALQVNTSLFGSFLSFQAKSWGQSTKTMLLMGKHSFLKYRNLKSLPTQIMHTRQRKNKTKRKKGEQSPPKDTTSSSRTESEPIVGSHNGSGVASNRTVSKLPSPMSLGIGGGAATPKWLESSSSEHSMVGQLAWESPASRAALNAANSTSTFSLASFDIAKSNFGCVPSVNADAVSDDLSGLDSSS